MGQFPKQLRCGFMLNETSPILSHFMKCDKIGVQVLENTNRFFQTLEKREASFPPETRSREAGDIAPATERSEVAPIGIGQPDFSVSQLYCSNSYILRIQPKEKNGHKKYDKSQKQNPHLLVNFCG